MQENETKRQRARKCVITIEDQGSSETHEKVSVSLVFDQKVPLNELVNSVITGTIKSEDMEPTAVERAAVIAMLAVRGDCNDSGGHSTDPEAVGLN